MTPRKVKHGALWNLFFKERTIQNGQTKTRLSLASVIILIMVIVGSLAFLEWCGAIDGLIELVKAARL